MKTGKKYKYFCLLCASILAGAMTLLSGFTAQSQKKAEHTSSRASQLSPAQQEARNAYAEYIRSQLLPQMGLADKEDRMQIMNYQNAWQEFKDWDQRTGLIGAQLADLDGDGGEECIVFYLRRGDTDGTDYYRGDELHAVVYTQDHSGAVQLIKDEEIMVCTDINLDYILAGTATFGGRTYLYTEHYESAYFADGDYYAYTFYMMENGQLFRRYCNHKSDGGSDEIAFSLMTFQADESYTQEYLYGDESFRYYNPDVSIWSEEPEEGVRHGFDLIGMPQSMDYLDEAIDQQGRVWYPLPTYADLPEIVTPGIMYLCAGHRLGESYDNDWELHIHMEDYTDLEGLLDDIKLDLSDSYKVTAGEVFSVSGDYQGSPAPDESNVTWTAAADDSNAMTDQGSSMAGGTGEEAVSWGGMSALTTGPDQFIISKSVTINRPGKYVITASAGSASDQCIVTVLPAKVQGLRPAENACTGEDETRTDLMHRRIHVTWDSQEGVEGYQIEISDEEDFESYWTITSGDSRHEVKEGCIYTDDADRPQASVWYVRAASYVTIDKKRYQGDFSDVLRFTICRFGPAFSLAIKDQRFLPQDSKRLTASLKPLFEAEDAAQQTLEMAKQLVWSVEGSSRGARVAGTSTMTVGKGCTIWIDLKADYAEQFDLTAAFPDGETVSAQIIVEPEMVIEIGAKLENGRIPNGKTETRISEATDVRCSVELKMADPQYLQDFMENLTLNREDLKEVLNIIKEETEYTDDGLGAVYKLRVVPAMEETEEPVKAGLLFTSETEQEAKRDLTVSNGQMDKLRFRSDAKRWDINLHTMEHLFYYHDAWFYNDPGIYQNDLAVMTLGLELCAFSDPTSDSRSAEQLPQKIRAANLEYAFMKLNFRSWKLYGYDRPLNDSSDQCAFAIAEKTISTETENDTLVAVIIRGGGYGAEWASNFHVGETGNHAGFDGAAKKVLASLNVYLQDMSKRKRYTGTVKLWVTGYSRGAAIANLLAHYINAGQADPLADASCMYAYTFATPSGAYEDLSRTDGNLFNIVSVNDLVPKVALEKWGFTKYGTTWQLPRYRNQHVDATFRTLSGDELDVQDTFEVENNLIEALGKEVPTRKRFVKRLQKSIMNEFKGYGDGVLSMTGCFFDGLKIALNLSLDDLLMDFLKLQYYAFFTHDHEESMLEAISFKIDQAHYPEHYLAWLESAGSMDMSDDTYARLTNSERAELGEKLGKWFLAA